MKWRSLPQQTENRTLVVVEAEVDERRRLAENLAAGALWREIERALSPGQAEQVLDLLLQIVEESGG